MKIPSIPVFVFALALAGGLAAAATKPGASMKEMHDECMQMAENMKDMDMKDMPMGDKMAGKTHHAVGTVKAVDMAKATVTIAHGPVKSLDWPAMTMTFGVKDKMLMDKMAEGKKIAVDFVQEGSDYTIVKVR